MNRFTTTLAALAAISGFAHAAQADTLYSNDFSTNTNGFTATPPNGGTAAGLDTAPSGQSFLGPLYNFGSSTLTLDTSPYVGQALTLSFSLYAIGSVDGDGQAGGAADPFQVNANGTQVFNYTFGNYNGVTQNYPTANSPADTGACSPTPACPSLGYSGFPGTVQDATYLITLAPFTATSATTSFTFIGGTNEALDNEYYGIDNVLVTGTPNVEPSGVPEPASWALMIAGFGAVGGMLRRQRATLRFA